MSGKLALAIALFVAVLPLRAETDLRNPSDVLWEFKDFTDASDQGWLLEGFANASVDTGEGILKLEFNKSSVKDVPRLEIQGHMQKARISSKDYQALEIKMRTNMKASSAEAKPVLRFEWRFDAPGPFLELPIEKDSKNFHVYRFDLTKAKGWGNVDKKWPYMTIFPANSVEIESGSAEIKSIRLVPTAEKSFHDKETIAAKRLDSAKAIADALERQGVKLPGATSEAERLAAKFKAIQGESGKGAAKALQNLNALSSEFNTLWNRLDAGRKIAEEHEAIRALEKTLSFRKSRGVPASIPDSAIQELKDRVKAAAQTCAAGGLKRSLGELHLIHESLRKNWAALDDGGWQLGVSDASFGRFGWVLRDYGLLVFDVERERATRNYFECANGAKPSLKFMPSNACFVKSEQLGTSWVSSEWLHLYKGAKGQSIAWNMKCSLLAPGPIIDTNSDAVRFCINAGTDASPARIVMPTPEGVKLLTRQDGVPAAAMSENWLLLLADNGFPEAPWLLVFQRKPDAIDWSQDALIIKRQAGAGSIGIANPWGVRPLPCDFAKSMNLEDVARQCRSVASAMSCYPWKCDEYFALDKATNEIRIAQKISHLKIVNDWHIQGKPQSPLPPVLAFAVTTGYPAKLPANLKDFGMPTKYGAYQAVQGDMLEYRLPLPDLRNPTYLNAGGAPEWADRASSLAKSFFCYKTSFSKPGDMITNNFACLMSTWCLLDKPTQDARLNDYRVAADSVLLSMDRLNSFKGPDSSFIERAEPFTGMPYLAYGWTADRYGKKLMGDITNFAGMHLTLLYLYSKYSGDWTFAKNNWSKFERLFSACPRRCDWAVMGQDCMESGLTHTIDMGPDSWGAPCYMAKLAEATGDKRLASLSEFMAAKQAVPLCATFSKRDWDMAYSNRWDLEKDIPEVGYQDHGVATMPWTSGTYAYNFMSGVVYKQECFNLYRDFCKSAATKFEYGYLEHYYPQWTDPKFKLKGEQEGPNHPGEVAMNLMLREACGEASDRLLAILNKGSLYDCGEERSLYKYVSCWAMSWLYSPSVALLAGRDAPCQATAWGAARLVTGNWNQSAEKAELRFISENPFVIELISEAKPESISINGAKRPTSSWSYDPKLKALRILSAGPGETVVALAYPDWRPPVRTPIAPVAIQPDLTPEMKICLAEKARAKELAKPKEDFRTGALTPIKLEPFLNMDFIEHPAGAASKTQSWFGTTLEQGVPTNGSGISNLPHGRHSFRGVAFQIADGLALGLRGHAVKDLPLKAGPIPVGQNFKRLFFLTSAAWDANDGEPVMTCLIKYEDGTLAKFTFHSGQETGDWWTPKELPKAKLAAKVKSGADEHEVGLYIAEWENTLHANVAADGVPEMQRPLRKIDSIELESTGKDGAIAVLAITGELAERN